LVRAVDIGSLPVMSARSADAPFHIDVWSDVVCPFCCLGMAQLRRALAEFEHADVTAITLHAYELHPNAPASYDQTLDELVAAKYQLPLSGARTLHERLEREADDLGLRWDLSRARPANTFDAHRLIAAASERGLAGAMNDRLFTAYFSDGELVSDPSVLARLGAEVGLNDASELLASANHAEDVRRDEADAVELGFSGVPAFLLDRRMVVLGAQDAGTMLNALNRAWARRSAIGHPAH
jgi:predicted DsbA family dithiol-disulfide isomerase